GRLVLQRLPPQKKHGPRFAGGRARPPPPPRAGGAHTPRARCATQRCEVGLTKSCDVSNAIEVTTGAGVAAGVRVYEEPISLPPTFQANRYLLFSGGGVTNRFRFTTGASATLALEAQQALSFVSRSVLVEQTKEETGLALCGAEAPPCPG